MKLKISSRIFHIREERRLSQNEMAELLGVSPSTYSRIERGETAISFEDLPKYASSLGISVQDLLPDTLSITNNSTNHQGGMVFGNIINYYSQDESTKQLELKILALEQEIKQLKDKQD
jgi:transcriptional regulator with XRE-family HTH domain